MVQAILDPYCCYRLPRPGSQSQAGIVATLGPAFAEICLRLWRKSPKFGSQVVYLLYLNYQHGEPFQGQQRGSTERMATEICGHRRRTRADHADVGFYNATSISQGPLIDLSQYPHRKGSFCPFIRPVIGVMTFDSEPQSDDAG